MQKVFSGYLIAFLAFVSLSGSANALSAYIPSLDVKIIKGEPCFYAQKKEDLNSVKNSELIRATLDVDNVTISQNLYLSRRVASRKSLELLAHPENCLKFSDLIDAAYFLPLKLGTRYHMTLVIRDKIKVAEGLPALPKEFKGSFCMKKDEKGSIRLANPKIESCELEDNTD